MIYDFFRLLCDSHTFTINFHHILYTFLYCAVDFVDDLDGLAFLDRPLISDLTFLLCAGVHASDG